MAPLDWKQYPNFTPAEMSCKHTGRHGMKHDFMLRLQALRTAWGKPLVVNSGYRHPTHPIEAAKRNGPGAHSTGQAVDIFMPAGRDSRRFVKLALELEFSGIGVSQRDGRPRFIHLDTLPREAIWSY